MTEREQIEEFHREYLSLRENTPWKHRDGDECKAYHKWYDSAYVYFKSFDTLNNDPDFQFFVNADKQGNCFVLEHIYDTISSSYKVLMRKTGEMNKYDVVELTTKAPMVFISHSSEDKDFVDALVDLLEAIGLDNSNLFCSSVPDYWIGLSQDIFESLRKLFQEYELYVIFVQSPRYYKSPVSLNEMGAAWVLKNDCCSLLTKDMTREQMRGVVNGGTIYIKVDSGDASARMNELKERLSKRFGLAGISTTTWERKRDSFLRAVNAIKYENVEHDSSVNEVEIKELQLEKLRLDVKERKQAIIRGNIIKGTKPGTRILKIFNSGKAIARNVNVEWVNPNDETFVHGEFGSLGEFAPQNSRSFNMVVCKGSFSIMRLRYSWSDDNNEINTFEEELQL